MRTGGEGTFQPDGVACSPKVEMRSHWKQRSDVSQRHSFKGSGHILDILVEMLRRKLALSLELRRESIAGFGCLQCTPVFNVKGLDKVNQGNIMDREEQIKGGHNPR